METHDDAARLLARGAAWLVVAGLATGGLVAAAMTGRRRIAWALVVANVAYWAITLVKAFLHVSGVDYTGAGRNDAVFVALVVFVIVPSLAATLAWALGFARRRG